jgi:PAS domain S-box-containing protein
MKTEHKVLVSAFLMGILIAVIDALLDSLFFYEGTFLELLIFNIPPHEFYIRSVVVICFISFGFVVGRVLNQREQAVEHSEYLYSVLSATRNVNQLIVKETDPDLLLQKACELLIETRGYSHSWIVLFDTNKQLANSASAGLGIAFEHMLEMVRRGEPLECMKRAMEQSGIVVFDALSVEHEACPIKPLCREGVALVTRLEARGGVQGVFGVGAPAGMVAEEELSLLKEVADDIAFALYSHEVEDAGSRAHLALMKSEERHRTLVSNIPGIVYRCELDDDWTMLYLSDRFQDITGYPSSDIIANQIRSYESIIHPDDRKSVRDGVTSGVEQKKPFTLEYRILHANGGVRWVQENGQAILDQDGRIRYLDGVIHDITEQRIAEDALRQSEQMYRALFESANDSIFIMRDNLFIECNDIALKMFGCNREEILFHSPDEFSPKLQPDGSPSKKRALKRIRAALAGEPQFFEWKHTRCDGAFFDAEVGLNAVQVGDDLAVQAIVRDITDRKRAEKEIKATAEAASLYLDLLGHDIRNHLQAIVMGTEILTSTDLDANLSSVTDLITESVERSRNLIQKVQVTRGLLAIPLSEKSLRSALEDSLEVLKATYEDLEIEVDYKIRRAIIEADQYLVILLMNLLENAIIHNNKRPRRVWVTLRKTKGGFEISIADNGPGISDKKKENLFAPERRFGGVGIHQALRIAQKYDGHISVDDRVANDASQGAKFRLWLPRLDAST